jgi:hypothetical protein
MEEALDNNILHIENIRNCIERLDETCNDIVDDMHLANRDKKNIPESYITWLDQMEKELTGLETQEKFDIRETGNEEEKEGLRKLRSKSYEGGNKKRRTRCFGMLWILWNKSYDGV